MYLGGAWQAPVWFVALRHGSIRFGVATEPLSRSASMRLRASRSGLIVAWIVEARPDGLSWGGARCVVLRQGNHHRAGTEADRRGRGGIIWPDGVCCVPASLGQVGHGHCHRRLGTLADQGGHGGMNQGRVSHAAVRWISAWRVPAEHGNHTRAGTAPDRRGRCGIELRKGRLRRGELVLVADRLVSSRQTTTLVQARGWINASGVGCIVERQGNAGWVSSRKVTARYGAAEQAGAAVRQFSSSLGLSENHHAVGAVPASTPDGGMHHVKSWCGMFGSGLIFPGLVGLGMGPAGA